MKTTAVKTLKQFTLCAINKDAVKKIKGGSGDNTTVEIVIEEDIDI